MSDFRPSELIERFLEASDRKAHLEAEHSYLKDLQDTVYSKAYLEADGNHNERLHKARTADALALHRMSLKAKTVELHKARAAVDAIKIENQWRLEQEWKERTYDKMEARHA